MRRAIRINFWIGVLLSVGLLGWLPLSLIARKAALRASPRVSPANTQAVDIRQGDAVSAIRKTPGCGAESLKCSAKP